MNEDRGYVLLHAARNVFEAQLLAGALESEGIPTHVDEDLLADEFTMSRKLMGLADVRVMVPAEHLARAKEILEDVRTRRAEDFEGMPQGDAAQESADEGDTPEPPAGSVRRSSRTHTALTALLAVAALLFLVLWLRERSWTLRLATDDPHVDWDRVGTDVVGRWKHNDTLAWRYSDADRDGVAERVAEHDLLGRLIRVAYDADEDAVFERVECFVPGASAWVYVVHDRDEDGHGEDVSYAAENGEFWRWLDADGDRYWETRELVREADGVVLLRHRDVGREGFRELSPGER